MADRQYWKDQWKVEVIWNLISPTLEVASGVIDISRNPHKLSENRQCRGYKIAIKLERGRLSYSAQKEQHSFPREWDNIKERVDDIVKAYFAGMCLDKSMYMWIDENWNLSDEPEGNNLKEDERTWAKT